MVVWGEFRSVVLIRRFFRSETAMGCAVVLIDREGHSFGDRRPLTVVSVRLGQNAVGREVDSDCGGIDS